MVFSKAEKYRRSIKGYESSPGDDYGVFILPAGHVNLYCIVSAGIDQMPWEHVSVSVRMLSGKPLKRCPQWEEMCRVKEMFWDDQDCVVQFHHPKSQYINNHDFVLHLWRPVGKNIETPPIIAV